MPSTTNIHVPRGKFGQSSGRESPPPGTVPDSADEPGASYLSRKESRDGMFIPDEDDVSCFYLDLSLYVVYLS